MSRDDAERAEYEARQKFSRDEVARVQYAIAEATPGILAEAAPRIAAETTRRSILRIGRHRLGEAPAHVVAKLETITSVEELEALEDRVLDCSSWDALWPS